MQFLNSKTFQIVVSLCPAMTSNQLEKSARRTGGRGKNPPSTLLYRTSGSACRCCTYIDYHHIELKIMCSIMWLLDLLMIAVTIVHCACTHVWLWLRYERTPCSHPTLCNKCACPPITNAKLMVPCARVTYGQPTLCVAWARAPLADDILTVSHGIMEHVCMLTAWVTAEWAVYTFAKLWLSCLRVPYAHEILCVACRRALYANPTMCDTCARIPYDHPIVHVTWASAFHVYGTLCPCTPRTYAPLHSQPMKCCTWQQVRHTPMVKCA